MDGMNGTKGEKGIDGRQGLPVSIQHVAMIVYYMWANIGNAW